MQAFAEGLAAKEHCASLLYAMGLRRNIGTHPSCALCGVREQAGREASPTTAIIDTQSAKGAQKGGFRLIRRFLMRARRSRATSGTFSSIPSASR